MDNELVHTSKWRLKLVPKSWKLTFKGGKGTKVQITYFGKFGGPSWNGSRNDKSAAGTGIPDTLILDDSALCYEPFWVRTFQFIRLTIKAGDEAAAVSAPRVRRTAAAAPWVERLRDISLRTLKNCMQEFDMDCPYYEQLQNAMDPRLEALHPYAVSSDTALVRKALIDFPGGLQPEGLISSKASSAYL